MRYTKDDLNYAYSDLKNTINYMGWKLVLVSIIFLPFILPIIISERFFRLFKNIIKK